MLKGLRKLFSKSKRATAPIDEAPVPSERPERARERAPAPAVHVGPSVVHRPIAAADLDPDAVKIVQRLTRFDHKAYLVGGCVRDLLLDRSPKDFDVATSATPRQIKRVFRNCRIIGRRFRLAHIYYHNGKIIEVATFRSSDGALASTDDQEDLLITEDNVFGTPEEDALRRDFTINSLFYDVNDETVLDHAGGLHDLKARLVRTIGDPEIRFREDPIRSLRAIKFAARLGFAFEGRTGAALERTKHEITKAAPPRVLEELNRFCRGGAARRSFELLRETGMFDIVLPEIAAGYRSEGCWSLLFGLLGRVDRERSASGLDVRTGEIFAALVLPVVAHEIGWLGDGASDAPPLAGDVRDRIDAVLRPLSLRLRVPRREQEHCRQILTTLFRMVPADGARRQGGRRSGLTRANAQSSLWMLEEVAALRGGIFAESLAAWREGPRPAAPSDDAKEAHEGEAPGGRRRRKRGGRGRGRRRSSGGPDGDRPEVAVEAKAPASEPRRKPAARSAARWSDDYFFEALPSVAGLELEEGRERYRSSTDSETAGPTHVEASSGNGHRAEAAGGEGGGDEGPAAPKRRRRRRGRRGRGGRGSGQPSDPEGSGETAGARDPAP